MGDGDLYPSAQNYNNPDNGVHQSYTGGAAHVKTSSTSEWSYGDWPNSVGDNETFAATTPADNQVVLTTNDVSMYTAFYVFSTGGSFSVQASLDGTNYSGDLKLEDLEGATATSKDYATTTTAGKLYRVVCSKAANLRILANGVTTIANGSLFKGND